MISNLTAPQQLVVDFLATCDGQSAERHILSLKKLDIRAANNLVKQGLVTYENGIYVLAPPAKFDPTVDEPTEAKREAKGAEQIPLTESRVEPTEPTEEPLKFNKPSMGGIGHIDATKPAKAPRAPKSVKEPIAPHACLCGCGATLTNKSLFAQGHDAKLHSRILKEHRAAPTGPVNVTQAQYEFLKTAHWMKPEILAALVVA